MKDALILCEGKLAHPTGKTARGLVRCSRRFRIVGVLDSSNAGSDAGEVVDGVRRNIPVFGSMTDAIDVVGRPEALIIGVATIGGRLPPEFREPIRQALRGGMEVHAGLHEFLSEDPEFSAIAHENGARIFDIRREPPLEKMHGFRNLASQIDAVRLPVLGTDSAIGKRTTAMELTDALVSMGLNAVFVATGQTGLLQGADYGVPLDSIQGDYMVGELENAIYEAYKNERPDVIIIEGQGGLTHPAYVCGTRAILSASMPSAIILQHAPGRKYRNYDPSLKIPLPDLKEEIDLLEAFSKTEVIALGMSHEGLRETEIPEVSGDLERTLGMPVVDVYLEGAGRLARTVVERFPHLGNRVKG